ncbi:hypothetical protein [Alkaliphilus peptidifermentans]|uniref:Lipoprotein n=1 Tax=Alkaliphilus peptidifermentans DSM 18978 TaxID=1120976 RepID=A0A1G5BJN2_9FIRM|nr:hypothetical protein [Alkaliphilus peptidifermentans]SCX90297.1 hypothetical protein SAMN03080606_00437 [Alkaliphilus peptidifermentans DSM 18978]
MLFKIKLPLLLVCFLIMALFITGCGRGEKFDSSLNDDEAIDLEEAIDVKEDDTRLFSFEELKDKLLEATLIELKDTDNQTIGAISDRDDIIELVETLFGYPWQDKFPEENQAYSVIGPINFYFDDKDNIFGLVKENYIYIEGYYFLPNKTQQEALKKVFQQNILHAPVSGT